MTAPIQSNEPPNPEAVMEILLLICEHNLQNEKAPKNTSSSSPSTEFRSWLETLRSISSAKVTMGLLASRLFITSHHPSSIDDNNTSSGNDRIMTSHGALTVMATLVTADPRTYLKEASRAVRSEAELLSSSSCVEVNDDVLNVVVSQLVGEDVEVSTNASRSIVSLCKRLPPLSERAIQTIRTYWLQVLSSNAGRSGGGKTSNRNNISTISVRCASAVIDLANLSDVAMESALSCGAMDQIMDMVTDTSDPLLQMSSLDLLEGMVNCRPMHGNRACYLFSKPVLRPLLQMAGGGIDGDEQSQPDPILGGTALRLLSSLFRIGQRDASLFGVDGNADVLLSGFKNALHNFNAETSENGSLAFIDAVSSLASSSPNALSMVLDDPYLGEGWLSLSSIAQPKLKSVVLNSVAQVIDPPVEKEANGDSIPQCNLPSNQMAMRLYKMLGEVNSMNSTDMLLSLARAPIVETRLGSYDLMRAVAKRGTGAQVLLSHSDFYEFLINRDIEITKVGKEVKFGVIEAVMGSDVRALLADDIVKKLEKILQQGPHYVRTEQMEMMTE